MPHQTPTPETAVSTVHANQARETACLRHPIYFHTSDIDRCRALAHLHADELPDPNQTPQLIRAGRDSWITQTFVQLKRRGHDVYLTDHFPKDQICIVYYDDIHLKHLPVRSFFVTIYPDRPRPHIAHLRIVQNPTQVRDPRIDHLITHWPQPGLIPRDPARGDRIQHVGFLGRLPYLAQPFRSDAFRQQLAEMNMQLVIREQRNQWHQYADLDAILAVRDVTPFDASLKPPSKLINAWHADCPALLGPEPAFQALRQSPLDYLKVRSPDQAAAALKKLRDTPGLRQQMVEQGRARRQQFTANAIADQWIKTLAGPVTETYERWLRRPKPLRRLQDAAAFPFRAVRHKAARRYFFQHI